MFKGTKIVLLLVAVSALGCGDDTTEQSDTGTKDTSDPIQCERVEMTEFEVCNFGSFGEDTETPIDEQVERMCASNCNSADSFILRKSEQSDLSFATGLTQLNGALVIEDNEQLMSLEGLDDVTEFGYGTNSVLNNWQLTDLKGLNSVTRIRDHFMVGYNGIETFNGLESLREVEGDLIINDNWNLVSFSALESLENIGEDLVIKNNEMLPQCEVDWLRDRVEVAGEIRVSNNGAETEADCSGDARDSGS